MNENLDTLLSKKFIVLVRQGDHNTVADIHLNEEKEEIAKSSQVPLSATELKKLRARMNAERQVEFAQGPTGGKRKLLLTEEDIEKRVTLLII